MNLLKFIPPSKYDYYRNLKTNRYDGISNVCDEEDYIYLFIYVDGDCTNNNNRDSDRNYCY